MGKKKQIKTKAKKRAKMELVSDFGDYMSFWHRYLRNRI